MIEIYKKILVGIDASDESKKAIQKVIQLYKQMKSEVVIFNSIHHRRITPMVPLGLDFYSYGHYMIPVDDYKRLMRVNKEAGEKILKEAKEQFEGENVPVSARLIEEKKPGDYILSVVEKEGFDLVILGYKGAHFKLSLGSVARKILNKLPIDFLIIR